MLPKVRRYLPKTPTDACAFIFTIVMIPILLLFELIVVLPSVYEGYPKTFMYYFHICAAFFLFINVMGNLWMTIYADTSTSGVFLPSVLKEGWRFCSACEANAPPRAFHCHICDRCILRRDHHCTFTGNCIGFCNQRYFLTLLLYMFVAGLYANIMNIEYVWTLLGGFSISSVVSLLFPMMAWVFGLRGALTMGASFLASLCMFGTLLMSGLLVYHFVNVLHGQTVHEKTHRLRQYDLGWKENLRSAMGVNWYFAWIFPAIQSPLPGDGLQFPLQSAYESPKTL